MAARQVSFPHLIDRVHHLLVGENVFCMAESLLAATREAGDSKAKLIGAFATAMESQNTRSNLGGVIQMQWAQMWLRRWRRFWLTKRTSKILTKLSHSWFNFLRKQIGLNSGKGNGIWVDGGSKYLELRSAILLGLCARRTGSNSPIAVTACSDLRQAALSA